VAQLTQSEVYQRQQPIPTGLDAATTAEEVVQGVSLAGKTAIVTGGYSGIGAETVRVFVDAGCDVIVPARDVARAKEALGELKVRIEPMDLLDAASIDAFADRFLQADSALDLLINNAGIMALPKLKRDSRRLELQFATNHLGHFQLTNRLLPALSRAPSPRVVSVSSWGHHFSPVLFDDPNFLETPYDPWVAYGQSKTANILFALALQQRYQDQGLRAYSLHPGGIPATNLAKHLDPKMFQDLGLMDADGTLKLDPGRNWKTIPQGAATQVWCATSPALDALGGVYCENCDVAELESHNQPSSLADLGQPKHEGVLPYALDLEGAERLWELSEKLLKQPRKS